MRGATRRRAWLFLRVLGIGTLLGVAYGYLIRATAGDGGLAGAGGGAIHGAVITAVIASVEIFGSRTRLGRALRRAPFLATVAVKGLLYGSVIAAVNLGDRGGRILGTARGPGSLALASVLFSFAVVFAFLFVFEIRQIVGARTLRDIVLGRYHRPRPEERFFLFVDVAGSTPLAERIGPAAVHRFLSRVFTLASGPADDHGGEIYQYVGDEMVVTWTVAEGRRDARPVACFFAMVEALAAAAPGFERDFGAVPRLRGALHAGPVISGEIGDSKRAIVFHGDVMNTAARLEQATRDLDRGFLASGDALGRLPDAARYAIEPLGPRVLRGRVAPVDVYAVGPRRPAAAGPPAGG
jgi:adenylate cyclase